MDARSSVTWCSGPIGSIERGHLRLFEILYEHGTPNIPLTVVEDAITGDPQFFVNDERGFDFIPRNF